MPVVTTAAATVALFEEHDDSSISTPEDDVGGKCRLVEVAEDEEEEDEETSMLWLAQMALISHDASDAITLLKRAASKHKSSAACLSLGSIYERGLENYGDMVIESDLDAAMRWYLTGLSIECAKLDQTSSYPSHVLPEDGTEPALSTFLDLAQSLTTTYRLIYNSDHESKHRHLLDQAANLALSVVKHTSMQSCDELDLQTHFPLFSQPTSPVASIVDLPSPTRSLSASPPNPIILSPLTSTSNSASNSTSSKLPGEAKMRLLIVIHLSYLLGLHDEEMSNRWYKYVVAVAGNEHLTKEAAILVGKAKVKVEVHARSLAEVKKGEKRHRMDTENGLKNVPLQRLEFQLKYPIHPKLPMTSSKSRHWTPNETQNFNSNPSPKEPEFTSVLTTPPKSTSQKFQTFPKISNTSSPPPLSHSFFRAKSKDSTIGSARSRRTSATGSSNFRRPRVMSGIRPPSVWIDKRDNIDVVETTDGVKLDKGKAVDRASMGWDLQESSKTEPTAPHIDGQREIQKKPSFIQKVVSKVSSTFSFMSISSVDAKEALKNVLKKDEQMIRYEFAEDDSEIDGESELSVLCEEPEGLNDENESFWSLKKRATESEGPSTSNVSSSATTPASTTKLELVREPAITLTPPRPTFSVSFEVIEPRGPVRKIDKRKGKVRMESFNQGGLDWKLKEVEDRSALNVKTICNACGKKGVNFPSDRNGRTFCSRDCRVRSRNSMAV